MIPDVHGSDERDEEESGAGVPPFRAERGTLYVVATPLGNLRDITLRALDILRTADVIAAEDTRVSATLLRHYGIASRPVSLHAHNEAARANALVERLRSGESVALMSDAGTPGISDPGARVVAAARGAGIKVHPIPGPSAAIASISAAGLSAERFVFVGFLSGAKKHKDELLQALRPLPCALVFYEAPHRVRAVVAELATALGSERTLTIAREVTKRFETIETMPLGRAAEWLDADPNRTRGEFVLIVDAPPPREAVATLDADGERWLRALLTQLSPAQAARVAAVATGVPREALYARALEMKPERGD